MPPSMVAADAYDRYEIWGNPSPSYSSLEIVNSVVPQGYFDDAPQGMTDAPHHINEVGDWVSGVRAAVLEILRCLPS